MHVTVTFRHMDSTAALKSYAEDKSEKLGKYLFEPIEIHWVLSVEKIRHIAEVTIAAKNFNIKAVEKTNDLYSSIDKVIDKLEKQVKKHKEKVKNHKHLSTGRASDKYRARVEKGALSEDRGPRIVKKDKFSAKPMSVEEAAMQLDVSKNEFIVFTNADTNAVCVLYRRKENEYGLIDTKSR